MTPAQEDIQWYLSWRWEDDYVPLKYDLTLAFTTLHDSRQFAPAQRDQVYLRFRDLPVTKEETYLLEIILGRRVWSGPVERMAELAAIPLRLWGDRETLAERWSDASEDVRLTTLANMRQMSIWIKQDKLEHHLPDWIDDLTDSSIRQLELPYATEASGALLQLHALRMAFRRIDHRSLSTSPSDDWVVKATTTRYLAETIRDAPTDFFAQFWLNQADQPALQPIVIPRKSSQRDTGALQLLGFRAPDMSDLRKVCQTEHEKVPCADMDFTENFSMSPSSVAERFEKASQNVSGISPNPMAMLEWEVSKSSFGRHIEPPDFVVRHDWRSKYNMGVNHKYLQVAEADFCTGWHIDSAGTSQYFYVARGVKHIFLVEPTKSNLDSFFASEDHGKEWDVTTLETKVQFLRLTAGEAMILPGGWIHAVYTPVNACVVSGNFIHDYNIPLQLAVLRRMLDQDSKNGIVWNYLNLLIRVSEAFHARFALLDGPEPRPAVHALPSRSHIRSLVDFLSEMLEMGSQAGPFRTASDRRRVDAAVTNLRKDLDEAVMV